MGSYKLSALALLALQAVSIFAAADPVEGESTAEPILPNLAVQVSTAFPQSEVFGVKLVNGIATQALLDFTNNEDAPVKVAVVGGALSSLQALPEDVHPSAAIIRNLSSKPYDLIIPPGEKKQITYSFINDMNPQDLRLNIIAVVASGAGAVYQVQAFNETVSVVEAPTSFFNPQILFLYAILAASFTGVLYFVYTTWIESLFPQLKKGGKGGERARRSVGGTKAAVPPKDQVSVIGADGPAVTTGALAQKAYDESWIPKEHINRPTAKRVKSGSSKVKTKVVQE